MKHFHMRLPQHDELLIIAVVALVLAILVLVVIGSLYLPQGQLPPNDSFKSWPIAPSGW